MGETNHWNQTLSDQKIARIVYFVRKFWMTHGRGPQMMDIFQAGIYKDRARLTRRIQSMAEKKQIIVINADRYAKTFTLPGLSLAVKHEGELKVFSY